MKQKQFSFVIHVFRRPSLAWFSFHGGVVRPNWCCQRDTQESGWSSGVRLKESPVCSDVPFWRRAAVSCLPLTSQIHSLASIFSGLFGFHGEIPLMISWHDTGNVRQVVGLDRPKLLIFVFENTRSACVFYSSTGLKRARKYKNLNRGKFLYELRSR